MEPVITERGRGRGGQGEGREEVEGGRRKGKWDIGEEGEGCALCTPCLTMSDIRRWDATHFNVSLRHFCSRSTSFPSALEVYHDYALYKFTIDIDIAVGIFNYFWLCSFPNSDEDMHDFRSPF